MKLNLKILQKFNISNEQEEFEVIHSSILKSAVAEGTNLWILFFAILIASLGLNVNSTAVIIGAMLISPLIGPIVGLGFGTATNDLNLLRKAFTSYLFSTFVGLMASTLYFLIVPIYGEHSEILARTLPTVFDVFIALFGGFAGIIALSSKQKGNVIPGVAIATAIMPPLCTAGYGLATLQLEFFIGAFYLYLINSVFIFTATFITANFLNFPKKNYEDPAAQKKVRNIIWVITIIAFVPSIFLTYNLKVKRDYLKQTNRFVTKYATFSNNYLLKKEIDPRKKRVILTFVSPIDSNDYKTLYNVWTHEFTDGDSLIIRSGFNYSPNENNSANNLKQENSKKLDLMGSALNKSLEEYKLLKSKMDSIYQSSQESEQVYNELRALYPEITEVFIQPGKLFSESAANRKLIYFVSITSKNNLSNLEQEKIKNWLIKRLKTSEVKLITQSIK